MTPQEKILKEFENLLFEYGYNNFDEHGNRDEGEKVEKDIKSFLLSALASQKEEIKERILGLKHKHIIDMELYDDTGGGEMCEICGKQGYVSGELCEESEQNKALDEVLKIIDEV